MKINLSAIIAIARKLPPGPALRFLAKAARYSKGGFSHDELVDLGRDLVSLVEQVARKHGDDEGRLLVEAAQPLLSVLADDLDAPAPAVS